MEKIGLPQNRAESHLKEGVYPIMVCIGGEEAHSKGEKGMTFTDFLNNTGEEQQNYEVDFYVDPRLAKKNNLKNAGLQSYVISPIDEKNKFSKDYHNCTGLVAVGIEKKTGKEISFLSHQNPASFLEIDRIEFLKDMHERLQELKGRCEDDSVDIIIIGGKVANDFFKEQYNSSVDLLSKLVKTGMDFEPVIVGGPKQSGEGGFGGDKVFFDTKNRRLCLFREPKDTKD